MENIISNTSATTTKILIVLIVFPAMFFTARMILAFPIMLIFWKADPRFLKIVDAMIVLAAFSSAVATCRTVWPKDKPKI